jgi:hypothetical protein
MPESSDENLTQLGLFAVAELTVTHAQTEEEPTE